MTKPGQARGEKFPIGTLARRSGATIETIRYYERIGLLSPPPRSSSGRRVYGHSDLRTLTFVRRARELGFRLEDIRTLLQLGGPGRAACGDVRELASRHLADIRSKLHDLQNLERLLASTVSQCSGSAAPECPVLDILDIERTGSPLA
ncbi:MAG: helix-turn-helix domain-containing protein [Alphaproteobacteria bacterium]